MSDAPETIGLIQDDFLDGIWAIAHKSEAKRATLYRRANLPPTNEECLRNEKVRELLREALISGMRIATLTPIEEVPEAIDDALAALLEGKDDH